MRIDRSWGLCVLITIALVNLVRATLRLSLHPPPGSIRLHRRVYRPTNRPADERPAWPPGMGPTIQASIRTGGRGPTRATPGMVTDGARIRLRGPRRVPPRGGMMRDQRVAGQPA